MASMTGKSSSNTPTKLPNGDSIMVYPFGMHFRQAQCFCKSLNNGHLASIHDEMEYQALEAAAKLPLGYKTTALRPASPIRNVSVKC